MTNLQNHTDVEHQLRDTKEEISACTRQWQRFQTFMCGWGVLVAAGTIAVTFLLCITYIPSTTIFPVYRDPYAGMFPLIEQGDVRVYPPFLDRSAVQWKDDTYFIAVPPNDLPSIKESLQKIIKSYPQDDSTVYRECFLQNPTYDHPCFFSTDWLGKECTETNDFGYRENNGTFNPCILIRIEDTGKWEPVSDMSQLWMTRYDPGFFGVDCFLKSMHDARKFESLQVIPQKGFSRLYFPISSFDPKLYLFPIVAVQVKQLRKGENVTILCQIAAHNAFYLKDNGLVTITFGSQPERP